VTIPSHLTAMPALGALVLAAALAGAGPARAAASRPGAAGLHPADGPPAAGQAAGYVAAGHEFRYAQAVIVIPPLPCRAAGSGRPRPPELYLGLAGPGGYARAGLLCRPGPGPAGAGAGTQRPAPGGTGTAAGTGGRWLAFVSVSDAAHPGPLTETFPLGPARPGDGVFASVYHTRASGTAHFVLSVPDGTTYHPALPDPGARYDQAQALADWAASAPAASARPARPVRLTQFLSGGFTTAHGWQGTFFGNWSLDPVQVTAPGPPGGVVAAPSYLFSDGTQRVIKGWGDVFGIWLYP
jgi:hypothetical protein